MKSLKNTIAILALIFTFSCSKDDDKPTPELTPVVEEFAGLLTKTVDSNDGFTAEYLYNNAKRLINYKTSGSPGNVAKNQNFAYNADGTLDQIKNGTDESSVARYYYNEDKKLIKKVGRGGTDIYNYTYLVNQVTEKYFFNDQPNWITIYTYDVKGNAVELKSYDQISVANPNGVLSGTTIYTYDNRKSASTSLPKEYLFPKTNWNNVVTEKKNSNPVFTNNYEYNEKGYPSKRITNYTRTYEYQ